jgi:DNA polymerase elongation subunit (family B)
MLNPVTNTWYDANDKEVREPKDYTDAMKDIISKGVNVDKLLNKEIDTSKLQGATITPNGQFFRTDMHGFLPKMMLEMYEDRKKFKKMMIRAKKDYEEVLTELEKRGLQEK